jgi:hypothetical protein
MNLSIHEASDFSSMMSLAIDPHMRATIQVPTPVATTRQLMIRWRVFE